MQPCRIFIVLATLAANAGVASAAVVFEDNFANGAPTNSDSANGFWSAGSGVTESAGKITLNTGIVSSGSVTMSSSVRSELDFMSGPLTFSWEGIAFTGSGGQRQRFNALLTSDGLAQAQSNDAILLSVRPVQNQIDLFGKANAPGTSTSTALMPQIDLDNTYTITGIDLTLDGSVGTFVVTVHHPGGSAGSTTIQGSLGAVIAAAWGTGGTAFRFDSQLTSGGSASAIVTLERFVVTEVPEPASLALAAAGLAFVLCRRPIV